MNLVIVLLSFALGCALANIPTSIYEAHEGDAPYTVSLIFRRHGSEVKTPCGGSIIGKPWILTAASCTHGQHYVDIFYGTMTRGSSDLAQRVSNTSFISHHLWPQTAGNDIALIRTPRAVQWSDIINKVVLPKFTQRNERFEDWWATTCGWGGTNNIYIQDPLRCVDVQVMDNAECSKAHVQNRYYKNGILCLKTPFARFTCGGDLGAPLVTHDTRQLIGIKTGVPEADCKRGIPAAFTRVTFHLEWIRHYTDIMFK